MNESIIIQNLLSEFPNIGHADYFEYANNNYEELLIPLIRRKYTKIKNKNIIHKFTFSEKGRKVKKIVI